MRWLPMCVSLCLWAKRSGRFQVDISKKEQRVLHLLAQGGRIEYVKNPSGKIIEVRCINREGWLTNACDLMLFRKLKRRRAIKSQSAQPYRITKRGLELVRAELTNR
jgi:uncharacterized protein YjhX (UPF0386 family)